MPEPDYAEEIGALRRALSSGELTIETQAEGRVTYRSVKEIRDAIAHFTEEAAKAAPSGQAASFGFSAVAFSRE